LSQYIISESGKAFSIINHRQSLVFIHNHELYKNATEENEELWNNLYQEMIGYWEKQARFNTNFNPPSIKPNKKESQPKLTLSLLMVGDTGLLPCGS